MNSQELCEKIRQLYPDIGACAIDLNVRYDQEKKAWVVKLEKDGKELETYLEDEEANACMLGRQCISLGIQVSQLATDLKERPATRQTEGV
ncbi:MAG: hypothetical protein PHC35_03140 [Deltaproteobacteria bacterium]|jgi:hypothetical protein|nr:hypothetical protein [Deltaproteobacteria bacterium]